MSLQTHSAWACRNGLVGCEVHHVSELILQVILKLRTEELEKAGRSLLV